MADYAQTSLALDTPVHGQTRRNDCESSREAAKTVDATRQRDVLHRELSGALLGLTADELADRTSWKREHISSRLAQMERWGLCYSSGKRINPNGIAVKIWFYLSASRTVDVHVAGGRV